MNRLGLWLGNVFATPKGPGPLKGNYNDGYSALNLIEEFFFLVTRTQMQVPRPLEKVP